MDWLTIPHGKSHAIMIYEDGEFEFWCGKGRTLKEVRISTETDIQCRDCLEYIENSKLYPTMEQDKRLSRAMDS